MNGVCAACGGPLDDTSEAEMAEEFRNLFPGESESPENCATVCDDCFQAMIAIDPPPGRRN